MRSSASVMRLFGIAAILAVALEAQCAGGGWRTYGFFTSAAGCASFAARFGG